MSRPLTGGALRSPTASPPPPKTCDERVKVLQSELATTQARLEPLLPASERFDRAMPNPDGERRIAADIERLLDGADHSLECRGLTCRVQVVQKSGEKKDFWGPLQSDEALSKKVEGQAFHAPRPAKDLSRERDCASTTPTSPSLRPKTSAGSTCSIRFAG